MANAIKQVSVQKGHDVTRFALQCFGGAGGQHACLVADALGMETVFIHPYAGVLSAYGMGLADQTAMKEQAVEIPLGADTMPELEALADRLAADAAAALAEPGRRSRRVTTTAIAAPALCRNRGRADRCFARPGHRSQPTSPPRIVPGSASRRRSGRWSSRRLPRKPPCPARRRRGRRCPRARPARRSRSIACRMFTGGASTRRAGVRAHRRCWPAITLPGPALVREANATTVIEPGWTAEVTALDHMILRRTEALPDRVAGRTAGAPIRCCWNCSTTCS